MAKPEITPELSVDTLISHYPFAINFLSLHRLQCIICGEPVWGTIAELARDKGYSTVQISGLVDDLNKEAKASETSD